MSQTIVKNALADFPESSRAYVNGQIAKLKSGRYNADDCLWRIASCAELPVQSSCYTQMTHPSLPSNSDRWGRLTSTTTDQILDVSFRRISG